MIITDANKKPKVQTDPNNDPNAAKNADAALNTRVDRVGKQTINPKGIQATAQNLKDRQAVPLMHFPQSHALERCIYQQTSKPQDTQAREACHKSISTVVKSLASTSKSPADVQAIQRKLQAAHPTHRSETDAVMQAAKRCTFPELAKMRTLSGPVPGATEGQIFDAELQVAKSADKHINRGRYKFDGSYTAMPDPCKQDISALCDSFRKKVEAAQPISRENLAQLTKQTIAEMAFTDHLHKKYERALEEGEHQ